MQSGHPGRHDPRVMTGGVNDGQPMKRRKVYKYESKEEALAARKKRRNRARKERRHRARKHELAASEEKTPQKAMRGGRQKKKRTSTSEMDQIYSTYKTEKTAVPSREQLNMAGFACHMAKAGICREFRYAGRQQRRKIQCSSRWRRIVERSKG